MTPDQERQLRALADLLRSASLNLLSRRDRERVWERHIEESLHVWGAVRPAGGAEWLDLGTGGGLPGLVLAVMSPETAFTLLDARAKKMAAVATFVESVGLENVAMVTGRAETAARDRALRARFDGVVSRAVGGLTTVVELSRGFVRDGGEIVAVRGGRVAEELDDLQALTAHLAVVDVAGGPVRGAERETWLVRMRAQGRPPERVPRSDGVPAARPLTAENGRCGP